jgi:hypothetical protein
VVLQRRTPPLDVADGGRDCKRGVDGAEEEEKKLNLVVNNLGLGFWGSLFCSLGIDVQKALLQPVTIVDFEYLKRFLES